MNKTILFLLSPLLFSQTVVRPEQIRNPNQVRIQSDEIGFDTRVGTTIRIAQVSSKPYLSSQGSACNIQFIGIRPIEQPWSTYSIVFCLFDAYDITFEKIPNSLAEHFNFPCADQSNQTDFFDFEKFLTIVTNVTFNCVYQNESYFYYVILQQ